MRVLYLSTSYVPDRGADSIHVMRMCAALAREGHDVELVAKASARRNEAGVDDPFAYYGVDGRFSLTRLPRPAKRGGGLLYSLTMLRLLRRRRSDPHLVYSRDVVGAWAAAELGMPVCYEAHGIPRTRTHALALRRVLGARTLRRVVVITDALRQLLLREGFTSRTADVVVAPDGADAYDASTLPSLPARLRIGYVGHLYPGRGIELLVELARRLPEHEFAVVGGDDRELERLRAAPLPSNLAFMGFVPPGALRDTYAAFHVLLMPYQERVSARAGGDTVRFMSPMKMFEYMAAGRPIISSDLPVLREVLRHGENARLVPPSDVDAWVDAIAAVASGSIDAHALAARAREDLVRNYTWTARARRVMDGIVV